MTRTITLIDGRTLPIRPIRPDDAQRLQAFHRTHSARTLYQRFFGHYPELSDKQAEIFSTVDGVDRLALIAVNPDDPEQFVGVVRLDRDPGSTSAEYAAIVTDAWQGQGVGHGLTIELLHDAAQQGITQIYALVLPGNQQMLAVLKGLGLPWRTIFGPEFERVEIELDDAWSKRS